VIKHLRNTKISEEIKNLDDSQVARMIFANYRTTSSGPKGLRLTHVGLSVMKTLFKGHEIKPSQQKNITSARLLYLDKNANLPYYVSREKIVVFESRLAVLLKLTDGDTSRLS
jgi:hypothetical protein